MKTMVSFPIQAAPAFQVSLPQEALLAIAGRAAEFIREGDFEKYISLLKGNLFSRLPVGPEKTGIFVQATREFAFADSFQHSPIPSETLEEVISSLQKEPSRKDPFEIKVLAKSLYRELRSNGFTAMDVMGLVTELLGLTKAEIQHESKRPETNATPGPHREAQQQVKITAKSIYRECRSTGFTLPDMMALASDLMSLVTSDIK